MHLQSLKLLCPTVKEEVYLEEIFDLTLSRSSMSHEAVPYVPAKFEVATVNG